MRPLIVNPTARDIVMAKLEKTNLIDLSPYTQDLMPICLRAEDTEAIAVSVYHDRMVCFYDLLGLHPTLVHEEYKTLELSAWLNHQAKRATQIGPTSNPTVNAIIADRASTSRPNS